MPLPPALSLSLFYLATFAVLGVYLPCLNLYFERIGLTGLQIGIVSLITPLIGALAPTEGVVLAEWLGAGRIVGRFGDGVMLPILILLLALNGFAAVLLPSDAPSVSRPALRPSLAGVMKGPGVGLFLAASVLSQASHGPYYVFYS